MKYLLIVSILFGKMLFAQMMPLGDWSGTLDVGGTALTLVLHIEKDEKGNLNAKLDSVEQNAKGIPIDKIQVEDRMLTFSIKKLRATYEGIIEDNEIAGKFTQGGMKIPLTLIRGNLAEKKDWKRPQLPKAPFPYVTEEITYENSAANVSLSGTLTLPHGKGPFPFVLLIAGSGPCDRDETIYGHKPFLVLSDHLARLGIGSLRSDKRGIGKSTGNYQTATSADFASDVLAGIKYLKTRKEFVSRKMGLIGHSEGGTIATMVAAQSKEIAFVVMMAGPVVSGEEILYEQGIIRLRNLGISEENIQKDKALREKMFAIVKKQPDCKKLKQQLRSGLETYFASAPKEEKVAAEGIGIIHPDNMEEIIERIATPWFRYFLTLDPTKSLKKVKAPILALGAEKDLQVPSNQNLPVIIKTLKSAKHKDFTVKELPAHNHLFQTCQTGAVSEYATIEETLSPLTLNTISNWVLEKTRKP